MRYFHSMNAKLAIHVFPFAKCEKDSVEAICASWLEPSINVRGGYFYVPLIHSCFFFWGGGRGADFSLFEFWYLLWQSSVILYLGIIPDSCSSKRRHIFNQHHFPFVLWEADLFSFEVYSFEIIKWLAHFPRIPVEKLHREKSSSDDLYFEAYTSAFKSASPYWKEPSHREC